MNFKSRILKLSILLMLVLVLIPAIAAEESSEAFFIEYEVPSEEVVVEESDSIEIEDAQHDVSVISDVEDEIEDVYKDIPIQDQSCEIEEKSDAIIIPEPIDCSVVETPDVIDEISISEEISVINCENISDNVNYNDVSENSVDEVTIKNIGIINQGSIFISKFKDIDNIVLIKELNTGTTNDETHTFKRNLIKVLELKNDLLINQDFQIISSDNIMLDDDIEIVICADKITSDFVFSIDNSVIGDENLIIFVTTSFCLKFTPCFDAFICRDFLDVGYFFGGNLLIATGQFMENFVETY